MNDINEQQVVQRFYDGIVKAIQADTYYDIAFETELNRLAVELLMGLDVDLTNRDEIEHALQYVMWEHFVTADKDNPTPIMVALTVAGAIALIDVEDIIAGALVS